MTRRRYGGNSPRFEPVPLGKLVQTNGLSLRCSVIGGGLTVPNARHWDALLGLQSRLSCFDSHTIPYKIERAMEVEVRESGLCAMREKRGLTQQRLQDVGVSQNYIPALEAGSRRPGPEGG
jgi:hypothetical protein